MKKSKFFLRSLCLVVVFTFAATFFVDAYKVKAEAESKRQTYDQYLADYYLFSRYDYYLDQFKLPYRSCIEDKQHDAKYMAALVGWEVATFSLEDVMKVGSKKYTFNQTMLLDILSQETDNTFFKHINENLELCQASTISSLLEEYNDNNYKALLKMNVKELNAEQLEKVNKMLSNCAQTKGILSKADLILDLAQYASSVEEVINKCVKVNVIQNSISGNTKIILQRIKSTTSDANLKMAIDEMLLLTDQLLTKEFIISVFGRKEAANQIIEIFLNKFWEELMGDIFGVGFIIVNGAQKLGKAMSKVFFTAEKDFELFYRMSTLYEFEDNLKLAVRQYAENYKRTKSDSDAKLFNASMDLLLRTYLLGMTYAEDYLDMLYKDGAVNLFLLNFRKDKYESYKSSIKGIRRVVEGDIDFVQTRVYNLYVDEISEQFASGRNLKKVTENKTSEQADADILMLKDLVFETNCVVNVNHLRGIRSYFSYCDRTSYHEAQMVWEQICQV